MNKAIDQTTPKALRQSERNIAVPFIISTNDSESWEIIEILRLLPKRRLVCLAKQSAPQQTIIIKLFFHDNKAHSDYQKELHGYEQMAKTNLLIPQRLSHGKWDNNAYYISYEYLSNTVSLSQSLIKNHYPDTLINQMLDSIATMHNAELQQIDLHLDNFLQQDDKLFCIDFGDIGKLLTTSDRVKNLANILSQLPMDKDTQLDQFLSHYNKKLEGESTIPLTELKQSIQQWRQWRIKNYLKKAARNCSEFVKEQNFRELMVLRREFDNFDWRTFCTELDINMASGKTLKDGNTATVCLVPFKTKQFVVKRYNIKNFRHLLSRFWRPSRAWISWQNAHRLAVLGISTPKPIAIIEKRMGWFRLQAYYITEYNANPDALSVYKDKNSFSSEQISAFKRLFDNLRKAHISHGDMKGNNLLLDGDKITLIDLDAMKQHSSERSFYKAHLKDINRFIQNWKVDKKLLEKLQSLLN